MGAGARRGVRRAAPRQRDGRAECLDEYGAESPAEFFVVATEAFFERPLELRAKHAALYAELRAYFRRDPAEW